MMYTDKRRDTESQGFFGQTRFLLFLSHDEHFKRPRPATHLYSLIIYIYI